jgi:hypothetical protein
MPHIEKLGFNAFWWSDLKSDESTRQCMQTLRRIGYHAAELKVDSFNGVTEWEQDFKRAERAGPGKKGCSSATS